MKPLTTTLIATLMGAAAYAQDSQIVTLSAPAPTQIVSLTSQQFEPIYESQPHEATCSREVPDHTVTSCSTVSDSVCSGSAQVCENVPSQVCNSSGCVSVPRRECHTTPQSCTNVPRRVCSDRMIYRTEYYSCTQYHDVQVGQRLVKTFQHQIEFAADQALLSASPLNVIVRANLGVVTASLAEAHPEAVIAADIASLPGANNNGSIASFREHIQLRKVMEGALALQMARATLANVALTYSGIQFSLLNGAGLENALKLSVNLKRDRSLWGDKSLIETEIATSSLGLVSQGANLQAIIPFAKLEADELDDKRYTLLFSLSLDLPSANIINAADFAGGLSKTIEGRLEKLHPQ